MLGDITALLCCLSMTNSWKAIREYADEGTQIHEIIIKYDSIHKTEKHMTN